MCGGLRLASTVNMGETYEKNQSTRTVGSFSKANTLAVKCEAESHEIFSLPCAMFSKRMIELAIEMTSANPHQSSYQCVHTYTEVKNVSQIRLHVSLTDHATGIQDFRPNRTSLAHDGR